MGTHIVDVEVDPETGKITILRYTAVQDAGKAIHPSYIEGPIQGGAVQGIGWALNEEYVFNAKGHMLNCSFLDYPMPVCLDLPMLDTVIVEVPNPNHPYGVRGVGETSVIPPLAAVTNAVSHAIGVRLKPTAAVAGSHSGGPVGENWGFQRHPWEVSRCARGMLPLPATVQGGSHQSR